MVVPVEILGDVPRTIYSNESVPDQGEEVLMSSSPSPIDFHNGDNITFHDGSHIAFHNPIPIAPDVVYSFKHPRFTYSGEMKDG